jgi:fatty acyl-CoA reductase
MAERVFKKRAVGLRAAIVRPSIIVAAKDEPFPGWTDSLAAAGGLTLSICIGLLKQIRLMDNGIIDMIPADFCSNLILVTAAFTGLSPEPVLNIVHSSSSQQNPLISADIPDMQVEYSCYNPWYRQVARPSCAVSTSDLMFDARD